MTDERAQGEAPAPDPGTTPAEPQLPSEPPPPLAPLVGQAGTPTGDPAPETTIQPTSTWEQPAHVPPPIPPPAVPQPAVGWAPPPALGAAAAAGQRTTFSLVAGILLIIGGILGALAGLAVAVFGSAFINSFESFGPIPELEGMNVENFLGAFVVFLGIIIAAYSVVYLVAGIGVVRSRDWGRVLGLVVGILSGLVWLSGLGGRQAGSDSIGGSLVALGIHAYIVIALLFFWRTKPSSA